MLVIGHRSWKKFISTRSCIILYCISHSQYENGWWLFIMMHGWLTQIVNFSRDRRKSAARQKCKWQNTVARKWIASLSLDGGNSREVQSWNFQTFASVASRNSQQKAQHEIIGIVGAKMEDVWDLKPRRCIEIFYCWEKSHVGHDQNHRFAINESWWWEISFVHAVFFPQKDQQETKAFPMKSSSDLRFPSFYSNQQESTSHVPTQKGSTNLFDP